MSTSTHTTTADELYAMPEDGHRFELWRGEMRRSRDELDRQDVVPGFRCRMAEIYV